MSERLQALLLLIVLVVALTWGVRPPLRPAVLAGLGVVLSSMAAVLAVFGS